MLLKDFTQFEHEWVKTNRKSEGDFGRAEHTADFGSPVVHTHELIIKLGHVQVWTCLVLELESGAYSPLLDTYRIVDSLDEAKEIAFSHLGEELRMQMWRYPGKDYVRKKHYVEDHKHVLALDQSEMTSSLETLKEQVLDFQARVEFYEKLLELFPE